MESAGVFHIGEAFHGNIDYVYDYQNHLKSTFNYPLYYIIERAFCTGSFWEIENYWFNARPKYPAPEYNAIFFENHDNPRYLNRCNNRSKYINAVVFIFLFEGIPIFYYRGTIFFWGK